MGANNTVVDVHNRNDNNTVNEHNHVMGNYGDGINTELGALGNYITNNESTGNGVLPLQFDLADHNPNADPVLPCETNTWQSNVEITENQPCID